MALVKGVRETRSRTNSAPVVSGLAALGEETGSMLLRMAAQERALSQAALQIFSQTDEEALLRVAVDVVSALLRVDVVALFLTSDHAGAPRCRAIGRQGSVRLLPAEATPGDAFAIDVLRRQAPRQCRSWSPPGRERCGSALAVPLASQGVALGALIVGRRTPGRFRNDHVSLLSTVAEHLALALLRLRAAAPRWREDGAHELLDGIAEGLLVVDDELRTIYLNPAAGETIGMPASAALGRPVAEVLELADDAGHALPLAAYPFAQALREDRPVALTAHVVCQGHRTPFVISAAPIRDQTAYAAYAVGVFHDCSHEKEMARLSTEFVSMASHEIRTPLTALQGFTEIMLSREVPPNVQRDWLSLMNQETVRLAALIEEMLDMTRIQSGQVRLKLAPIQVGDVVCQVVRLLDGDDGRVHLRVEPVPPVIADGDNLAQVVTNLLRNALDYSRPERPVEVEIAPRCLAHTCQPLTADGASHNGATHTCRPAVGVAVRDRGIGMTSEELSHAFQPFYRAQASRELRPQGSGLGLTIARAIMERHQGCLWAHGRPGRGSTFGFCLPTQQELSPGDGAT